MNQEWTISWVWWITVIEIPAFGCLFWIMRQNRLEAEAALLKVYREIQANLNVVLENLAQAKLEVARLYATVADLKDVEKRLTDHLLRLEARLTYAFQTEQRSAERRSCRPGGEFKGLEPRGGADAA
jgi:hypothetical protein